MMHVQKTFDFVADSRRLVRPDRQIVYANPYDSATWPPSEQLHDAETITVDRISQGKHGAPHRFIVKLGDTVNAYMGNDAYATCQVTAIDHDNQAACVADPEHNTRQWKPIGIFIPRARTNNASCDGRCSV